MLSGGKLIGFVPVTDPDRSRRFYTDVLGLPVLSSDGFAIVLESNGNPIRLVRMEQVTPQPFTILGWEVADLDGIVPKLSAAGVSFRRYPGMNQDAIGIWTAPDGDRVAWFEDPDGHLLSLSEHAR